MEARKPREPEAASAILPGMPARPRITIVGAGNLGTTLAMDLHQAGYAIAQIVFRNGRASRQKASWLAKRVGARAVAIAGVQIEADLVWFCVPDDAIAQVARSLADKAHWKGRIALHSSGALTSDELVALRRRGAHVASVHPMMTFVAGPSHTGSSPTGSSQAGSSQAGSQPSLSGVPFAIEGDAVAVRTSRRIVKELGSKAYAIGKQDKVAYHAWGTFASPLLTALLATTGQVAATAGISRREAKRRMLPILRQTLANYAALDAAGSFSGPIVRGDVETIRRHLGLLRKMPAAREVYVALARAAVLYLPGKRKELVKKLLDA
jgi:predicted short-subunit dehydrogenase-like oxidoreductase (DUF2520 family)